MQEKTNSKTYNSVVHTGCSTFNKIIAKNKQIMKWEKMRDGLKMQR